MVVRACRGGVGPPEIRRGLESLHHARTDLGTAAAALSVAVGSAMAAYSAVTLTRQHTVS